MNISRHTIIITIISFLINISSGMVFGNIIPISIAVGLTGDALGFSRAIGNSVSYISKVSSAFFSDIFTNRRFFLLLGYGLSIIIKPLFILSMYDGISQYIRIILFIALNIIDKFVGAIRDIPRDALIVDLDPHNIKNNIIFYKSKPSFKKL